MTGDDRFARILALLIAAAAVAGLPGCAAVEDEPPRRVSIICSEETFGSAEEARSGKQPGPCSGLVMDINATAQEKRAVERAGEPDGVTLGSMYAICAANRLDEVLAGFPDTPEPIIADGVAGAVILCPDTPVRGEFEAYVKKIAEAR